MRRGMDETTSCMEKIVTGLSISMWIGQKTANRFMPISVIRGLQIKCTFSTRV